MAANKTKRRLKIKRRIRKRSFTNMISQKVLQMMRQVDSHISKKERLKALSVIEDIEKEMKNLKTEQLTKAKQEKQI